MTCRDAGGRPAEVPTGAQLRRDLGVALARGGQPVHVSRDAELILRRFADDARPIFEAVADEDYDEAARRTNALLTWCRPAPRLDNAGDGWHMHFHGPTDELGDGWAAGCAAALTMAIGSRHAGRLGVCEAPRCDRVYVDSSKNGTRRFCGVTCQNRVKNAQHRARNE
ncbi:CGNR zinc finger domain-containing protein [Beutenbergia cavernae]|nr:CGNR zinc finger domain-containing protein [Beutenbergia cavernae]